MADRQEEPATEAGRQYLRDSLRGNPFKWADTPQKLLGVILAIEREAQVLACSVCAGPVEDAVCRNCYNRALWHEEAD